MSYWYRDCTRYVGTLLLLVAGGPAWSAETYFEPRADVGAQVDSNRTLISSGDPTSVPSTAGGYSAAVGATWGISTPVSDSIIRPQIGYQDFPQIHASYLHSTLDLNSQYRSERGQGSLQGNFDRQATYGSELASSGFNPVNPGLPTTPETGRISTDTIRTLATAAPSYTYELTRRLGLGLNGIYQRVDYSGTNAGRYISYDYYLGGTSLNWTLSPRADTALGVFGSRESAKNGSGSVKSEGVTLAFGYKWSRQFTGRVELTAERDDSEIVRPAALSVTSTKVGAVYTSLWQGEISKLQLSVGRTFTPSGAGGTFRADQFQVEYRRDLTARLAVKVAGRTIRATSVSGAYSGSDYNYVNAEAGLKWKVTRTWHLGGGVQYVREAFATPVGAAIDRMLYAGVGYQGLGRP
jgi:hypothetical protein